MIQEFNEFSVRDGRSAKDLLKDHPQDFDKYFKKKIFFTTYKENFILYKVQTYVKSEDTMKTFLLKGNY
jgi:hypothetical protein